MAAPAPRHAVKPKTAGKPENAELVKKISLKYPASQPYVFEGPFEIARRTGEDPKQVLAAGTIKLTGAPGGKYRLHLENSGKLPSDSFDMISDGKTQWTYIPALNQYTEQAVQPLAAIPEGLADKSGKPGPRETIGYFSLQLVPMLGTLATIADKSFVTGPVLTVVAKKDQNANQDLLYLTIDATTLAISKLAWIKAFPSKPEKMLVRLDLTCKELRSGEPIADSQFTFTPPANAKLVTSLPPEPPAADTPSAPADTPDVPKPDVPK
ncbi:MAG: hypothetical protein M3Z85_19655 [Acidobacteriota bacterium]|nr:hypothetical protein [Acidobacteriota bacterium]